LSLEQRVVDFEKEVADLKQQLEGQPHSLGRINESIQLAKWRKSRIQKHIENATNPEQRQALLDVVTRLDCYVQSLQQQFQ